MKAPTLTSTRLTLRNRTQAEMLAMRQWRTKTKLVRFVRNNWGTETDAEIKKGWQAAQRNPELFLFTILPQEEDKMIGICALSLVPKRNAADLSIFIGEEKFLSKGYGTEAIALLRDFAFGRLKINRLELTVHADNPRAIACYAKCGFRKEGFFEKYFPRGKKMVDTWQMRILKKEWRKLPKTVIK